MSSIEKVEKEEFKPLIVAFCCNWCSYAGADLAGTSKVSSCITTPVTATCNY